jgi:hypothetical protein
MNFHDIWQGEFHCNLPVPTTATGTSGQLAKYSPERKKHFEQKLQREIKHIFATNTVFSIGAGIAQSVQR